VFKVAFLSSTGGSNLPFLIQNSPSEVEFSLLISNKKDAKCLEVAKSHGLPSIAISTQSQASFEQQALRELLVLSPDLIILNGFMRILSSDFISQFSGKIINIHPALLPSFKGWMAKAIYKEVIQKGIKITGATVHLVTSDLDGGPILAQKAIKVTNVDNELILRQKVQQLERELLLQAIIAFRDDKVAYISPFKVQIND
jgi:phosphoribosylglycinamide formyltransferase-1